MSPIVFVLGLTSWLSTIPLPIHQAESKSTVWKASDWKASDWKARTPIPAAPENATPSYDRVLVKAMVNGELQVKNRNDFDLRLKQITEDAIKNSISAGPHPSAASNSKYSLEIKTKSAADAHIGYCISFVKTIYASCGVWIPASSFSTIQTFGSLVPAKFSYKVGDLIYVDRTTSGTAPHVGIYLGDDRWKHPGHPNLPNSLRELSKSGYEIVMVKRLVA